MGTSFCVCFAVTSHKIIQQSAPLLHQRSTVKHKVQIQALTILEPLSQMMTTEKADIRGTDLLVFFTQGSRLLVACCINAEEPSATLFGRHVKHMLMHTPGGCKTTSMLDEKPLICTSVTRLQMEEEHRVTNNKPSTYR